MTGLIPEEYLWDLWPRECEVCGYREEEKPPDPEPPDFTRGNAVLFCCAKHDRFICTDCYKQWKTGTNPEDDIDWDLAAWIPLPDVIDKLRALEQELR